MVKLSVFAKRKVILRTYHWTMVVGMGSTKHLTDLSINVVKDVSVDGNLIGHVIKALTFVIGAV